MSPYKLIREISVYSVSCDILVLCLDYVSTFAFYVSSFKCFCVFSDSLADWTSCAIVVYCFYVGFFLSEFNVHYVFHLSVFFSLLYYTLIILVYSDWFILLYRSPRLFLAFCTLILSFSKSLSLFPCRLAFLLPNAPLVRSVSVSLYLL